MPRVRPFKAGFLSASATVRGAEAKAKSPVAVAGGVGTGAASRATNAGVDSFVGSADGTAFGHGARVTGAGGTAIGAGAVAGGDGIAIGRNVDRGAGIHIGHEQTIRVQIGNFSLNAMRTDIADNTREVSALRSDISNFNTGLRETNDKLNKAVAMAMAQQTLYVAPDKRATVGLSHAGYGGEHGIAASFGVRVNEQIQVHFSGATDAGFDEKGIKSGVQFSW